MIVNSKKQLQRALTRVKAIPLSAFLAALAAGCASHAQFQFRDSHTGRPISGVAFEWYESTAPVFGRRIKSERKVVAPSNEDGMSPSSNTTPGK